MATHQHTNRVYLMGYLMQQPELIMDANGDYTPRESVLGFEMCFED